MADIIMSLDDTLELDTIIQRDSSAINPIGTITENNDGSTHNDDLSGFQTKTAVFDPSKSGTYTIPINGQELIVEVTNPNTIPDSAVSQFEFNEGSGTTVGNKFSNSPNATIYGAEWISDTQFVNGYALDLVSSNNDYINIGSNYSFVSSSNVFTFCITVNFDDHTLADQILWSHGDGNMNFTAGIDRDGGHIGGEVRDSNGQVSKTTTDGLDSSVLRLGVSYDGPNKDIINVAINGQTKSLSSDKMRSSDSLNVNVLGGRDETPNFVPDAKIDNPIWYDKLLSESEFNEDYESQPWS